jgi:ketosteroid isomerase-like protein
MQGSSTESEIDNFGSWEAAMDMKKILEDFDTEYNEAFNRGDVAGCVDFFAEDILLLAPDQTMIRGKRAMAELYQSRMDKASGGTHTNKLVGYGVEGNLAYQIGTYAITGTNLPEVGKFVNILRRQEDGTWKVYVSIFNSDKP